MYSHRKGLRLNDFPAYEAVIRIDAYFLVCFSRTDFLEHPECSHPAYYIRVILWVFDYEQAVIQASDYTVLYPFLAWCDCFWYSCYADSDSLCRFRNGCELPYSPIRELNGQFSWDVHIKNSISPLFFPNFGLIRVDLTAKLVIFWKNANINMSYFSLSLHTRNRPYFHDIICAQILKPPENHTFPNRAKRYSRCYFN